MLLKLNIIFLFAIYCVSSLPAGSVKKQSIRAASHFTTAFCGEGRTENGPKTTESSVAGAWFFQGLLDVQWLSHHSTLFSSRSLRHLKSSAISKQWSGKNAKITVIKGGWYHCQSINYFNTSLNRRGKW